MMCTIMHDCTGIRELLKHCEGVVCIECCEKLGTVKNVVRINYKLPNCLVKICINVRV